MSVRRKVTAEELVHYASDGLTMKEAAAALSVTYQTLSKNARRHKIKFRHPNKRTSPGERECRMKELYEAGYTLHQIGVQFGLTRERVRQLLSKHFRFTATDGGASICAQARREKKRFAEEVRCLAKYGCTKEQYVSIKNVWWKHRNSGGSWDTGPLGAFFKQKQSAKQRGIEWHLTLWQWWSCWQVSGKWKQRGRGHGYAMCRFNDCGPYASDNIYIATCAKNASDANNRSGLPTGVSIDSKGRFRAACNLNGKTFQIGTFSSSEQAHAAYLSTVTKFREGEIAA